MFKTNPIFHHVNHKWDKLIAIKKFKIYCVIYMPTFSLVFTMFAIGTIMR